MKRGPKTLWDAVELAPTPALSAGDGQVRRDARDTSRAAAVGAGKARNAAYEWIRSTGENGSTDWEGEEQLELIHQTYAARRRELVLRGLVTDTGRRRMGGHGFRNIVWGVTTGEVTRATRAPWARSSR